MGEIFNYKCINPFSTYQLSLLFLFLISSYAELIGQHQGKAISFINENWSQLEIAGISDWKDGRLYNNEQVSKAWFKETNKDRYLK